MVTTNLLQWSLSCFLWKMTLPIGLWWWLYNCTNLLKIQCTLMMGEFCVVYFVKVDLEKLCTLVCILKHYSLILPVWISYKWSNTVQVLWCLLLSLNMVFEKFSMFLHVALAIHFHCIRLYSIIISIYNDGHAVSVWLL